MGYSLRHVQETNDQPLRSWNDSTQHDASLPNTADPGHTSPSAPPPFIFRVNFSEAGKVPQVQLPDLHPDLS